MVRDLEPKPLIVTPTYDGGPQLSPNRRFKVAPFSAVGLVPVSPIACATAPPLVWLAGALDVSVSFFVDSRDGCYELLAV